MSRLSRESRALLAASRHLDRLSARDKARIRGKLTQRIGTGVAVGSLLMAGVATAEAARSSLLLTIAAWAPATAKVLGVVAVVSATTAGVVAVSQPRATSAAVTVASPRGVRGVSQVTPDRDRREATNVDTLEPTDLPDSAAIESPRPAAVMQAQVPPSAETRQAQMPLPTASMPAVPRSLASVSLARKFVSPRRNPVADEVFPSRSTNSPASAPAVQVSDRLLEQAAAIRTSRAALRNGDARTALAALDQGLPEGAGPLEQEALLARITAYCQQGSAEQARRVAERFLLRFADSLLVPRVRSSCAFEPRAER